MSVNQWQLQQKEDGLYLASPASLKLKPFKIDFNSPMLQHRVKTLGRQSPLIKALGNKKNHFNIIDATAGLGRDAFLMASKGHHVTLIEKNNLLAQLLQDALQRAQHTESKKIINNMQLMHEDSIHFLTTLTTPADIIYIDPMFPERQKSALVKKDMQILKHLMGHENKTENNLLTAALKKAAYRVIVKRPPDGSFLNNMKPDFQIKSKVYRFDVYVALRRININDTAL